VSIHKTVQTGGDEPLPQALLELQQLALGMFLIYDVLGEHYENQELVERAALSDWAAKHKIRPFRDAIKALVKVKNRYMEEPWAHYIHCRDFKDEGWANVLSFTPHGNQDVLEQINSILKARPFKDPPL
jgi:hypothetical protein